MRNQCDEPQDLLLKYMKFDLLTVAYTLYVILDFINISWFYSSIQWKLHEQNVMHLLWCVGR